MSAAVSGDQKKLAVLYDSYIAVIVRFDGW